MIGCGERFFTYFQKAVIRFPIYSWPTGSSSCREYLWRFAKKKADLTGLLSVRSSGSVATSTSAGLAGGHVFAIHTEADGNKWSELPEPPSLN